MIEKKNFNWSNWAGNHSCLAENYFEPETEAQIIEVVRFAVKHHKKIRVVGSGHSFSPIAVSNEILVSLKNYRKLIAVGNNSIRCQGGMYLHELYSILKENKLSLPDFGVINKQTVAGALATGALTTPAVTALVSGVGLVGERPTTSCEGDEKQYARPGE